MGNVESSERFPQLPQFCWTELGAECVGIFHSLIATCRLQGIDPYTYLVDVLQRVDDHPASDVAALTPRLWKDRFADDPRRSVIDRVVNNAVLDRLPCSMR